MSLKIGIREMGDITILDVSGRITLGEGAVCLRDTCNDLFAKDCRNLLLNLREVRYIDSAGLCEVCSSLIRASRAGGSGKLLHVAKRVGDLLAITKLSAVFQAFDDETVAVRSFHERLRYSHCPVCAGRCSPPAFEADPWEPQTCTSCASRLILSAGGSGETAPVARLDVRSYETEYWEVRPGPPFVVNAVGRLNMFSSRALENCWKAIPAPRRVLFDLSRVEEVTPPGVTAMGRLLGTRALNDNAVVSLEGLSAPAAQNFRDIVGAYGARADALNALGDVSGALPWSARIEIYHDRLANRKI